MTPGVRTRIADFHPFEQLAFEVDTSRETLLAAVLDDTFGVVVGERSVIRRFVAGSRQREGVVGIEGRAGDLVDPVRPFAQRERVGIDRTGEGRVLAYVGVVGVAAEIGVVVAVLREFRRVHNVELTGQLGEAHVGLEGDVDLALGAETPLGGDEDDAVCAARTVDRRRGGVLEDRDRFDVGHVQVVDEAADAALLNYSCGNLLNELIDCYFLHAVILRSVLTCICQNSKTYKPQFHCCCKRSGIRDTLLRNEVNSYVESKYNYNRS